MNINEINSTTDHIYLTAQDIPQALIKQTKETSLEDRVKQKPIFIKIYVCLIFFSHLHGMTFSLLMKMMTIQGKDSSSNELLFFNFAWFVF